LLKKADDRQPWHAHHRRRYVGYRDWVTGYRKEGIIKKKINAI
jgi:integrase